MGMDVGSSTGSMASPNIVPLIDILLVLIIIFMVITPSIRWSLSLHRTSKITWNLKIRPWWFR
jgi:biopolymer transport protein ExbD